MQRYIILLIIYFCIGSIFAEQNTGQITVTITDINQEISGQILIGLFTKDSGFPDTRSAFKLLRLDVEKNVHSSFINLPYGEYAIVAVHDENKNEKMDMKWLPYPHPGEGFSVSNNPITKLGPPKFIDGKFTLSEKEKMIHLKMKYW